MKNIYKILLCLCVSFCARYGWGLQNFVQRSQWIKNNRFIFSLTNGVMCSRARIITGVRPDGWTHYMFSLRGGGVGGSIRKNQ